MYKDKEKQKESDRERARKYRLKQKGVTQGVTKSGCDAQGVTKPKGKITCFEDLPADVQRSIERLSDSPEEKARRTANAIAYQQRNPGRTQNTGLDIGEVELPEGYKTSDQLAPGEHNRISKPGDDDYPQEQGLCHTCGAETQIKAITRCKECIEGVDKAAEALNALPELV